MLHKTTDKQFQMMLEVHNVAPFRIIRAASQYMRLKDGEPRSIVNVRNEKKLTPMISSCIRPCATTIPLSISTLSDFAHPPQ
jgi:hypothetical protein